MTKLKTRILLYISIALLLLSTLFPLTAFAMPEVYEIAFDNTDVMDDLNDATVFGKKFDVNDYPKTPNGEVRLLDFAEYCFSTYPEYQKKFGLYVYVYNPTGAEIRDNVDLNKIQVATEYKEVEKQVHVTGATGTPNETQTVIEIEPSAWGKYPLKLLSKSADNVFYKFKIADGGEILNRVIATPELRRYDVSGIELFGDQQTTNAKDYPVGGTWQYSGFAKGCDLSAEEQSTLTVNISQNQVLTLGDLKSTYYRAWTTSIHANQLNSVYFSVPKNIADDYDELYSIQAETYKYLTSPIFCVYDRYIAGTSALFPDYDKLYQDLLKQRGISNPYKQDSSMDRVFYWTYIGDSQPYMVYNTDAKNIGSIQQGKLDKMAWIFQVSDKENWTVSSDRLIKYMQDYSAEFGKEIRGKYSEDLFADEYYFMTAIEGNREFVENGYMPIDISIDDEKKTLLGSSIKFDAWKWLFGNWDGAVESEPIIPIVSVSIDDLDGLSNEDISKKYFVALGDVDEFKGYVRSESLSGRIVYLFRFAHSKYYTDEVKNNYGTVGYMAQEVAYLDFDIISLGYRKDGVVTKMPVVSSPIDIVSAIESGKEINDLMYWLKQLFMLMGIVILLLCLLFIPGVVNLLLTLLKFAGWLLALPFKALGRLFKAIFKRRKG